MTNKFKVGDWVVRKKEHPDHPFWHKYGSNPIKVISVFKCDYEEEEIVLEQSDGNSWMSQFFDPCLDPNTSTNLEDYL